MNQASSGTCTWAANLLQACHLVPDAASRIIQRTGASKHMSTHELPPNRQCCRRQHSSERPGHIESSGAAYLAHRDCEVPLSQNPAFSPTTLLPTPPHCWAAGASSCRCCDGAEQGRQTSLAHALPAVWFPRKACKRLHGKAHFAGRARRDLAGTAFPPRLQIPRPVIILLR